MSQQHHLEWSFPEISGTGRIQLECSHHSTQSPLECVSGRQGDSLQFSPNTSPSCSLQELFCVCGALKRARLVHPGVAEVVFVKKDDAITAYKKYNNRCLDGK